MSIRTALVASSLLFAFACGDSGSSKDPDASPDAADDAGDAGGDATEPEPEPEPEVLPEPVAEPEEEPEPSPDVQPEPEPAGAICPEIVQCRLEACAREEPEDAGTCFTGATCDAALTADETTAADALVACIADHCNTVDPKVGKLYECQRVSCLPETVACWGAGAGTEGCGKVTGCAEACVDPLFGDEDVACVRGCLEKGKPESVPLYWDLELCLKSECIETPADETCEQKAKSFPECSEFNVQCQGDVGAAPGAGSGQSGK